MTEPERHADTGRRWTDADMAQAYLAGYNAAYAINVPPLDLWQGELEDIAEDFGFWLSEVYEHNDGEASA